MTDMTKLHAVAAATAERNEHRAQARIAAEAWYNKQMEPFEAALDEAVWAALDADHTAMDVARAYTLSGATPDRNAIHAIKSRRMTVVDEWADDVPFKWKKRTVTTKAGKRVAYDVFAEMDAYGPDEVTGTYTWRFDLTTGELDEVLTDLDPYPSTDKFYKQVLDRWVVTHPYPGEE